MKVNWIAVGIIAVLVWWLFMGQKKSYYVNSVCQAADLDAVDSGMMPVVPVAALPSVADVSMGTSKYTTKSCMSCGM